MTTIEYPLWIWILFFSIVLIALFVDIGIVNRRSHVPSKTQTLVWSVIWVGLAVSFNGFIYYNFGLLHAKRFFTGYLIELSLSVDNLFVFLLIFSFFKVPKKLQHGVLFWGIIGALVMRMIMIFAGAELVEHFDWILYIFGAFLIYTGINMFRDDDSNFELYENRVVRWVTRYIPISREFEGDKFFTEKDGTRVGTLLFLVLIVVELTDLVFAIDSIPAIFGITTDRFIVYTSNIFAILGLRTFYFLLADLADRFYLLKYALGFILGFIGLKMLLPLLAQGLIMVMGENVTSGLSAFLHSFLSGEFDQEAINISLAVVIGAIFLSVVLSMLIPKKGKSKADMTED